MSQNHATIKQPGAFSTWYNGNSGQRTVGAFYSLGASVVIIGALFKIMHWPGAGYVLTAGMVTELSLGKCLSFSVGWQLRIRSCGYSQTC